MYQRLRVGWIAIPPLRDGRTMTIEREDVDGGRVDFSDVAAGRRLAPVHPGEVLREEFLTPLALSVYRLARAIGV